MTLVEILVVVGIISTLTGIAIPVLSGARSAAHQAACAITQRGLHVSMSAFAADNTGVIPGVNTTGRRYLSTNAIKLLGNTRADMPTTTFDWMSPILADDHKLSPNRAQRTAQLFSRFACPSTTRTVDALWGYAPDRTRDFEPILEEHGFHQISYLSPASFHLAGRDYLAHRYKVWGWRGPAIPPDGYTPAIRKIGAQPSTKAFVADGTRYLTADGTLDFDVHPDPEYFGSFTSSSPIYVASTAYGDKPRGVQFGGEAGGARGDVSENNKRLSYRHNGQINVAYFDGHVGAMSEHESKRDASPWYPGGSRFTGDRATPRALETHQIDSILE
jgi:prepilin-type processing-associated H-X9-DG protein